MSQRRQHKSEAFNSLFRLIFFVLSFCCYCLLTLFPLPKYRLLLCIVSLTLPVIKLCVQAACIVNRSSNNNFIMTFLGIVEFWYFYTVFFSILVHIHLLHRCARQYVVILFRFPFVDTHNLGIQNFST